MRTGKGALLAALTAMLTVSLGAGPSLAASSKTWTVRPGRDFSAASTSAVKVKDTTTGNFLQCRSMTMSGTLRTGSGLGSHLGRVSTVTILGCGQNLPFHLTAGHLPWQVQVGSYDPAHGMTTGTIAGLHIGWSGPGCAAVIDGTGATADDGVATFTYTNGTHAMRLLAPGGNLHFWNVQGCAGLIATGDRVTITGTYQVTPPQQITSP